MNRVLREVKLSTNKKLRAKTPTRDTPKSPLCQLSKLLRKKLEIKPIK